MGSKQQWEVGHTVNLGGRELLVTGRGDKRAKGEAAPWLLQSPDGQRAYEWVPFRGLRLVRGEPVRPARAARRKRQRIEAKQHKVRQALRPVTNKGLWGRLLARLRPSRKPPANKTITRAPGATNGPQPRHG